MAEVRKQAAGTSPCNRLPHRPQSPRSPGAGGLVLCAERGQPPVRVQVPPSVPVFSKAEHRGRARMKG